MAVVVVNFVTLGAAVLAQFSLWRAAVPFALSPRFPPTFRVSAHTQFHRTDALALCRKREKFIIEHFQVNIDEAMDNLATEILDYPPWRARLEALNRRAYLASEFLMGAILINFAMSAYMILGMHYTDQTCVRSMRSADRAGVLRWRRRAGASRAQVTALCSLAQVGDRSAVEHFSVPRQGVGVPQREQAVHGAAPGHQPV